MRTYSDAPKYLRDFLTYIDTIKGKSHRTANAYYSDLKTFLRFVLVYNGLVPEPENFYSDNQTESINAIKDIPVKDVPLKLVAEMKLDDLYEYMAYVNRARKNNSYSRARKVSSLKAFYKYLHLKVQLIDENPTELLDAPKIEKSLPKYLELDESIALLQAVEGNNYERDFLILTLFLNCGMRLSELCGINISNIRKDTLRVTGKGNKQRTIYLNEACMNALNAYLAVRPHENVKDKDALFLNKNKSRLGQRSVEMIVKKYVTLAGLDPDKYTPHKLRHTAATLMYKYGDVDIRALQDILGHTNLSTTEIYTHVDDQRLRSAVEKNPLSDIKINIKNETNES